MLWVAYWTIVGSLSQRDRICMLHCTGRSSPSIGGEYAHGCAHIRRLSIPLVDDTSSYKDAITSDNVPHYGALMRESSISHADGDKNYRGHIVIYAVVLRIFSVLFIYHSGALNS